MAWVTNTMNHMNQTVKLLKQLKEKEDRNYIRERRKKTIYLPLFVIGAHTFRGAQMYLNLYKNSFSLHSIELECLSGNQYKNDLAKFMFHTNLFLGNDNFESKFQIKDYMFISEDKDYNGLARMLIQKTYCEEDLCILFEINPPVCYTYDFYVKVVLVLV